MFCVSVDLDFMSAASLWDSLMKAHIFGQCRNVFNMPRSCCQTTPWWKGPDVSFVYFRIRLPSVSESVLESWLFRVLNQVEDTFSTFEWNGSAKCPHHLLMLFILRRMRDTPFERLMVKIGGRCPRYSERSCSPKPQFGVLVQKNRRNWSHYGCEQNCLLSLSHESHRPK